MQNTRKIEGARVLFIDDEPGQVDGLADYITTLGAVTEIAVSGRQGLDFADEFHPDLVLLDMRLQDLEGVEILKQLLHSHPVLDVVIVTGQASAHNAMTAVNLGAIRYYIKPLLPRTLLNLVEEVMERKHLRQEADLYMQRLVLHNRIAEALATAEQPDEVATAAVEVLAGVRGVSAAAIIVIRDKPASTRVIAGRGFDEETLDQVLECQSIRGDSLVDGEPCPVGGRLKPVYSYTLFGREQKTGILLLSADRDSTVAPNGELVRSLARGIGMALERAVFHQRLERAYGELKVAQRSLVEAEKASAVGRLAAGLVHEIGTPLNIISARAEYLMELADRESDLHQGLKTIVDQIERISALMQQLLDFARQYPTDVGLVELGPVIQGVRDLVAVPSRARNTKIDVFIPPSLPLVVGNDNQMQQVFINLILNSLDAIVQAGHAGLLKDDGKISIYAEELPRLRKVVCYVEDNGIGIRDADRNRIFEPFFTTKEPGKGTGLGLSVVYGIITELGGTVEVESQWEHGTRVILKLPVETV